MGISGLLPILKKASKNCHVRKFSGCTVAIDAYCWLHKGAFGCAEKLGKGEPTVAYITYCLKYIQVLLDNNIKPILVLDGRNLPSKEHTEKKRRQKRDENRKLARKYLQEGKKKEAWECFTRCVDITPAMAREFIKELRNRKIDYIVAPYEADAQLAFLAKNGIADIVITEDSDLILFGCPKIFFKMNVNGDGVLFEQSKIPQCLGLTPKTFQFERFRWMCILSGCDYLASIPGIGLGRAKKVILTTTHNDIRNIILAIPSILDKQQIEVPDGYIEGFLQAENTFLYQLVFDTSTRAVVPLNKYPENIDPEDLTFAGRYEEKSLAIGLALGNVDLHSLKTVDDFDPATSGYLGNSIWSRGFNPSTKKVVVDAKFQTVGMELKELSVSLGSPVKMKRPLSVTNIDNMNGIPKDCDLLNMYAVPKRAADQLDNKIIENDVELSVVGLGSKRRKLNQQAPEMDDMNASPSSNTRSRRSAIPFLKSPDNVKTDKKIIVKSKYFSSPEQNIANANARNKIETSHSEEVAGGHAELSKQGLNIESQLSIYSIDSNSESLTYEKLSSQYSDGSESHLATQSSEYFSGSSNHTSDLSLPSQKTEMSPEMIELDGSDSDGDGSPRKYNTLNSQRKNRSSASASSTSSSNIVSISSARYAFTTRTTSNKSLSCRQQGLSRKAKQDPKQLSVKDMFLKQKSK